MTYRETLKKAEEHKIEVIPLSVATELDNLAEVEEIEFTAEKFEKACSIIERAYMKTCETSIFAITQALLEMIKEEKQVLEEIDVWDLLGKASYYN